MSDYVKATNFAAKDGYPVGDTRKKVKGTEIDNEFNAIASAVSTKANTNSPEFTGTPIITGAVPAATTDSTQIATTAFVQDQKDSPVFIGTPTAPTAATTTDTTQIATTAFVQQEITANEFVLEGATASTLGGVKMSLAGQTLTIETS